MAGDTIILHIKLQRPAAAPDILPQPRLLEHLNEGHQGMLTLISAPAGYGIISRYARMIDNTRKEE